MATEQHSKPDEGGAPVNLVAVERRLYDVGHALLAIRRLAIDAQQAESSEHYLVAIQEMARSSFRGVDACIEKLSGNPAIGNFATEFEPE